MEKTKILFVCTCNLNRSPTFEKYFQKKHPEFEFRSAGTMYGYPYQVNKEILEWADRIYVMDLSHAKFIYDKYKEHFEKVIVVGVSDQYDTDSDVLIEIAEFWNKHLFGETVECAFNYCWVCDDTFTGSSYEHKKSEKHLKIKKNMESNRNDK